LFLCPFLVEVGIEGGLLMKNIVLFLKGFWVMGVGYLIVFFVSKPILNLIGFPVEENTHILERGFLMPVMTAFILVIAFLIIGSLIAGCVEIGKEIEKRKNN
jgi:hypothetical protein